MGQVFSDSPSKMPEVTPLSPDLARSVAGLARTLVAAARNWSLYPPEHPAVGTSLERLRTTLAEASDRYVVSFGVTPDTLLFQGLPAGEDGPVSEAAAWLHAHDVLQVTFAPEVPLV